VSLTEGQFWHSSGLDAGSSAIVFDGTHAHMVVSNGQYVEEGFFVPIFPNGASYGSPFTTGSSFLATSGGLVTGSGVSLLATGVNMAAHHVAWVDLQMDALYEADAGCGGPVEAYDAVPSSLGTDLFVPLALQGCTNPLQVVVVGAGGTFSTFVTPLLSASLTRPAVAATSQSVWVLAQLANSVDVSKYAGNGTRTHHGTIDSTTSLAAIPSGDDAQVFAVAQDPTGRLTITHLQADADGGITPMTTTYTMQPQIEAAVLLTISGPHMAVAGVCTGAGDVCTASGQGFIGFVP
jgi:hypothetical protein